MRALALLALLLLGCGHELPEIERPDPNSVEVYRAQVDEYAASGSIVRSTAEAYCPQLRDGVKGLGPLCDAVEALWPVYRDSIVVARGAVDAYRHGLLSLDDTTRAIALLRRAGDEARAAAREVRDAADQVLDRDGAGGDGGPGDAGGEEPAAAPEVPPGAGAEAEAGEAAAP